ncbi:ectonucleoside triphosphate diphosphohydrolase 1-like [Zophobas morio]|uniref:ectonucleoside triphosphate diphosphohydrolase 1-like n=1 Tax=Zophobas morio TaxID=2755281 RepID=UPI003083CC91
MGGSSLQLAYQVKDVKGSPENIVHLKLGSGHNYHVFTASFDDYGSDSVYNKYVQALSNQLKDEEASYCFPPGFNFTEEQSTKSVSKDPQGNFENCSRSLKSILDLNCIQAQCSINGKSLPPFDANMKIYGLASFYYITNDFKAYDEDNKLNKSKFVDEATKYCSTQWEEIQKMTKIRYREKTCLKASYINLLLEKGFNITQGAEFYTVQNVNDLKVSWTLGALLHALNAED